MCENYDTKVFFNTFRVRSNIAYINITFENGECMSHIKFRNKKYTIITNNYENDNLNSIHALLNSIDWINCDDIFINLSTDIEYLYNCINWWIIKWERNDFLKEDQTERPNSESLKKLVPYIKNSKIRMKSNNLDSV